MERSSNLALLGLLCLCIVQLSESAATVIEVTLDNVFPEQKANCQFPFTYKSNTYLGCTNADSANPANFWCSVDAVHTTGRWGYCPVTLNKPDVTTAQGKCTFPVDETGPASSKVRFYECSNAFEEVLTGATATGPDMCRTTTGTLIACTTACSDTFLTVSDTSLQGGTSVGTRTTENLCKAHCLTMTFNMCAGVDYDGSTVCWIFSQSLITGSTLSTTGVTHSTRMMCDASTTTAASTPTGPVGCVDPFTETVNANQLNGVRQAAIVTKTACETDCLSVSTCTGYDFTTGNECWRHNMVGTVRPGQNGVSHYERVNCNSTGRCTDTFEQLPGKQLFDGTAQTAYNGNMMGCQNFCLGDPTCSHYEIDSLMQCWWHAKMATIVPQDSSSSAHTLYKRIPCQTGTTPIGVCRDTFTEKSNAFKYDGMAAAGTGSLNACKSACLGRTELCVSFDYDTSSQCFLHNEATESGVETAGTGVSHYTRNFVCNMTTSPMACSDTFMLMANKNRPDGSPVSGVTTRANCEAECLKTKKSDTNGCYGYDFDTGLTSCFLQLGSLRSVNSGTATGVNTYARLDTCASMTTARPCVNTYFATSNSNALGGNEKTASSQAACEALCSATKMGATSYCYGYDWVDNDKTCWFQEGDATYSLNTPASGVTNYRRTENCDGGSLTTATGGCTEQYNVTLNRNVANGQSAGQVTVLQCKAICENRTDCYGFDHANGECWLILVNNYSFNTGASNGVTNYRRLFSCTSQTITPGCQDTFTYKENVIVYGGILQGDSTTVDACKAACRANADCKGFNFARLLTTENCYLFLGTVGDMNDNPSIDLYTREDNCAAMSTTPVTSCTMVKKGDGNVAGGTPVNTVSTQADCLKFCQDSSSCMAVDFDKLVSKCFWFLGSQLTVSNDACCEHYEKECAGTCMDTFNKTVNMGVQGGVPVPGRDTLMACQEVCKESSTCEAFDFNRSPVGCFVLTTAKLNAVGSRYTSTTVDHYDRVRCPNGTPGQTTLPTTVRTTLCQVLYQRTSDMNMGGGRLIGTFGLSMCQSACTGDDACTSIDYNRAGRDCYTHTSEDQLNRFNGVDHYAKVPCSVVTQPTPSPTAFPTASPTACDIDLSFIVQNTQQTTAAQLSFERQVMSRVLQELNFAPNQLRLSLRRFNSNSDKYLSYQASSTFNKANMVPYLLRSLVNLPNGNSLNLQGALTGFLSGDTSGRAEVEDSVANGINQRIVLVVISDLNTGIGFPESMIDDLHSKTHKVMVVPLTNNYNPSAVAKLRATLLPLSQSLDASNAVASIVASIRQSNPLCIASSVPSVPVLPKVNCYADIVLLIDNRPGQGQHDLDMVRRFAKAIVSHVRLGYTANQVALIAMHNGGSILAAFNDFTTANVLLNSINNIAPSYYGTDMAGSLRAARQRLFTPSTGDRVHAKNVVIIVSRGHYVDNAVAEANLLKQSGVVIVAVGLQGASDEQMLRSIVSAPPQNTYISIADLPELALLSNSLTRSACQSVQLPITPLPTVATIAPTFVPTVAPTPQPKRCIADVVLVMDTSGSIRDKNVVGEEDNFRRMVILAQDIVDLLDISRYGTHFAAVTFSNYAETNIYLNDFFDKANLKKRLAGLPYQGGNTNTTGGLRQARTDVLLTYRGDRIDIKNVIVIITDGVATREVSRLTTEVTNIRKTGTSIIGVGVTMAVDESQMRLIVDNDGFYLYVMNFHQLADLAARLTQLICSAVNT